MIQPSDGITGRRGWWLALLGVALCVRAGVLLARPDGLARDPDGYRNLAETWQATGVYGFWHSPEPPRAAEVRPTAFRPPLYPMLLALGVHDGRLSPASVAILHLVLGLGTVWATVRAAQLLALGRWQVVATGILVTCDPLLLNQSTQVMTETLAAFLASLAIWLLAGRAMTTSAVGPLALGGVVGLASLCRPTFLPWSLMLAGVMFWGGNWRRVGWMLLGVALVVGTWGVRNRGVLDRWKFTTTHGGYTLLLGNNDDFYGWLRGPSRMPPWSSEKLDRVWLRVGWLKNAEEDLWALDRLTADPMREKPPYPRDEFGVDALGYDIAHRTIAADPAMFGRAVVWRVSSLWQWTPQATRDHESLAERWLRIGTAVWYAASFVLLAVGAWRLGRRWWSPPWMAGLLLCFTFTLVHCLYWSNMRMRAPLVPFLVLLTAGGITGTTGPVEKKS